MKTTYLWRFLLFVYSSFLYWVTVFRRIYTGSAGIDLRPLWTYRAIADGNTFLICEVLINIAMFFPIGILIGLISKRGAWVITMIIGMVLSLGIELLQFSLKRGLCETDDVIHNTIGCMIGFSISKIIIKKR